MDTLDELAEYLRETETTPIQKSVNKWNLICSSEVKLAHTIGRCGLCFANECEFCPLTEAGESCLQDGSIWQMIRSIVKNQPHIRQYYLNQIDHPRLTYLCLKMRDTLVGLKETNC